MIDKGDSQPILQLPRRVPFSLRKEISRMVQDMVDGDVVQESASPWASPVVLVKRKTERCNSVLITGDSMQ